MNKKYDRIINVSIQVLRQEVLSPGLKWKVTNLSRISRVARSQIYELLGKSKKEILLNALSFLLEEVYGLSNERREFDKTHGMFDGVIRSRKIVMDCPELLAFYFRARTRSDDVGQLIRKNERKLLDLVALKTGIEEPVELLFIRTIMHGIGTAPYLTDREVGVLIGKMASLISVQR